MLDIKKRVLFLLILFIWVSLAFSEEKSWLDLDPIVISKAKVHLLSTYSLESNNLEELPYDSFIEALTSLPIDLQGRSLKDGIQTDFSLRGSTYQDVLILINGQRVNDPKLGHYNCDLPFTRGDIQRIEVIPGAGSSLFGPDAIGGAVNIILKKPKERKVILEGSFGSHQTKSGTFSITEKKDSLGLRFSLEREESKGFHYDTDFKNFIANLNSNLEVSDGELNIDFGYLEKEFGAYDFYTPGKGYPSKEWVKAYFLDTGFQLEKKGLVIKPNFLWRRHYDKFMLDKTSVRSNSLNHHRSDVYTPNIYLQKEAGVLGRAGLGIEYGQERVNSTVLGKHTRSHESIFIDDSKEITPRVSLGLSLRADDYDSFGQAYSGSSSLKYKILEETALRFGISKSIRIPTFHELYYDDVTTTGNSTLSTEKALNYEAGLDYKKEKISLGATFFSRLEKDIIDWVKRTSTQSKWEAENITEDKVFGIENYLRLEINPKITFDSNYTYIDKRLDDKGYLYKYGPNYIRHLINGTLNFNLPFGAQSIGFTYKKKPVRDGWFLFNTKFSYNFNPYSQIFLNATNLLNVEYQEIEGIPQPGRWLELGLRLEW